MRIGSGCSGVGGLELGLEWAGLGHVVWQIEQSDFRRRVLSKIWPQAKRYDDVCTVGKKELAYVDIFCFGSPCQDISGAGKGEGLAGARSGLFYQCARIAEEVGPEWIIMENVVSGASRWVDECSRELARIGYATLPVQVSASDVGAWHPRARIFLIGHRAPTVREAFAYVDEGRQQAWLAGQLDETGGGEPENGAREDVAADAHRLDLRDIEQRYPRWRDTLQPPRETELRFPSWRTPEPPVVRVVHGLSDRAYDAERRESLGDSVVPQCAEVPGHVIRELVEQRKRLEGKT